MKKNKRKKYGTGTAVKNYITSPAEMLAQNQINIAKAKSEAAADPLTNIMSGVGNAAMQYGLSQSGFAEGIGNDKVAELLKAFAPALANMKLKNGGTVPGVPVEVEGGEVAKTPFGDLLEFNGPDHKNGGIKTDLPENTEVYSKRIKVDNKTMAQRKKSRERAESSISKLFDKAPTDKLLKKTLERTKKNNEREDEGDRKIQELITSYENSGTNTREEFGGGGEVRKKVTPIDYSLMGIAETPLDIQKPIGVDYFGRNSSENTTLDIGDIGVTTGDVTGFIGQLMGTFGGKSIIEQSRATDTPNINAFEDFGKDALAVVEDSKSYIAGERDKALQDSRLNRASNIKRLRGSARGVNAMRALDIASGVNSDLTESDIYSNFSKQMMQILQQQAGLENVQDRAVMTGEEGRDLADREDKDAYYSNLAENLQTEATGIQRIGKNMNAVKQSNVIENLLNQLSKYGLKYKNGEIVGKTK